MRNQQNGAAVSVFYSYAHQDEALRQQLETHLSLLRRQGLISEWHNREILPGAEWAREIDEHLETASIILLLVSSDFLASDYCYDIEMQRALERHTRGEARVIPVILRPCEWQQAPFAHLQVLPHGGKSATEWNNLDAVFLDITQGIRKAIERQTPPARPLLSLSPVDRQNRSRLLKRVRAIWIEGLLEQSLHRAAWIDLHLQEQPDALENPWRMIVQELDRASRPLPVGTSIMQVYDEADGELLILGEPGAGKTTLLLQLASDLLKRAEQESSFPMPVVFNLSSWAELRQPLTTWLIAELRVKYQVPQQVATHWIEAKQILPLLDGLDEVSAEARLTCVQAISAYYFHHASQIGVPLIVCCRSQEYEELSLHLPLSRAVSILPLTEEQIDAYLSSTQGQLEGLRQALDNDAELATLAHRPLMLSVFTLAYQEATANDFPVASSSHEQTLHAVFSCYVKRMLSRRGPLLPWMHEQFLHWLTFVAKQLHRHQQTVLLVEDLQPSWLPQKQQHLYQWSVRLFFTLISGLLTGLVVGLPVGLIYGLIYGLPVGLIYGLLGGLLAWLLIVRKFGRDNRIQPAEVLTWSWKQMRERLSFVRGFRWGCGSVVTLVVVLPLLLPLLLYVLPFVPVVVLAAGLSGKQLTERFHLSPNEGTWRSMKNGLRIVLVVVLVVVLVIVQAFLPVGIDRLLFVPFAVLAVVLITVLPFVQIVVLMAGLDAFIQHFVLRIFLWRTKYLPWKLIPFLDEAAERLLLRKVGGSYIFIHRLLLDYFASLETTSTPTEEAMQTQQSSTTP